MAIEILEETEVVVRHCPMYKVIMHDDPVSTFEFVIDVLKSIFQMVEDQAIQATQKIHNTGQEIVGVYSLEQAEFKVEQTHSLARGKNFPLTCTIEKVI